MLRPVLVFCILSPVCHVMCDSIYRFSLPLFNEKGEKFCDIFGRQAVILDKKKFNVFDISINTLSADKHDTMSTFSIISDRAEVNSENNNASGSGFIAISNNNFSATGSDWIFHGDQKTFTLNKNVQVFFEKHTDNN